MSKLITAQNVRGYKTGALIPQEVQGEKERLLKRQQNGQKFLLRHPPFQPPDIDPCDLLLEAWINRGVNSTNVREVSSANGYTGTDVKIMSAIAGFVRDRDSPGTCSSKSKCPNCALNASCYDPGTNVWHPTKCPVLRKFRQGDNLNE